MAYEVVLHREVTKALKKMPGHVQRRVSAHLKGFREDPRPHGYEPLTGYTDMYRVRVGQYRILYEIHDDTVTVYVLSVSPRGSAYKP